MTLDSPPLFGGMGGRIRDERRREERGRSKAGERIVAERNEMNERLLFHTGSLSLYPRFIPTPVLADRQSDWGETGKRESPKDLFLS